MFGAFNEALVAAETARSEREAQAQNTARLAFSMHNQESAGVGSLRLAEPVMFDVTFLTRPFFLQGAGVKLGPDLQEWNDPVGSAGVHAWVRNEKEHYIGAWMYVDIVLRRRDGEIPLSWPDVRMIHDFAFMGYGFKDLGSAVAVQAQTVGPRAVGFGGV